MIYLLPVLRWDRLQGTLVRHHLPMPITPHHLPEHHWGLVLPPCRQPLQTQLEFFMKTADLNPIFPQAGRHTVGIPHNVDEQGRLLLLLL